MNKEQIEAAKKLTDKEKIDNLVLNLIQIGATVTSVLAENGEDIFYSIDINGIRDQKAFDLVKKELEILTDAKDRNKNI